MKPNEIVFQTKFSYYMYQVSKLIPGLKFWQMAKPDRLLGTVPVKITTRHSFVNEWFSASWEEGKLFSMVNEE